MQWHAAAQSAQHRNHERVSSVLYETVDPKLKSTMQRELRAENLVLRKDKKQAADGNAQSCQSKRIAVCKTVRPSHDSAIVGPTLFYR